MAEKRVIKNEETKGFSIQDLIIVAVLLAAGAVLKLFVGSVINFFGMNLISELLGAVMMFFMMKVPFKFKKMDLNPLLSTFVSTVVSGGSFVVCLFVFMHMETSGLVAYIPIVLGTAAIGSVLVQLLYLPLKKVLNR